MKSKASNKIFHLTVKCVAGKCNNGKCGSPSFFSLLYALAMFFSFFSKFRFIRTKVRCRSGLVCVKRSFTCSQKSACELLPRSFGSYWADCWCCLHLPNNKLLHILYHHHNKGRVWLLTQCHSIDFFLNNRCTWIFQFHTYVIGYFLSMQFWKPSAIFTHEKVKILGKLLPTLRWGKKV